MPKPTGISGSRISIICGLNSYQTPLELWQSVHEQIEPGFNAARGYKFEPFEGNASTRFGSAFEDSVMSITEQKHNIKLEHREKVFRSGVDMIKLPNDVLSSAFKVVDGLRTCHVDAITNDNRLYEGKTAFEMAFKNKWGEPGSDRIPKEYQGQVQHNMELSGTEEALVSVLVFPKSPQEWEDSGWVIDRDPVFTNEFNLYNDDHGLQHPTNWAVCLAEMGYFHNYHIQADKNAQKLLRETSLEWWDRFIINKKEPEPINYEDLKRVFCEPVGTIVATEELTSMCVEYKEISREIGSGGALKKRQAVLKTEILKRMRGMDSVLDSDSREKTILRDDTGKRLCSFGVKGGFRV